ncbi:MAG: YfhO family protein [Clostridiaceae bacterium]|nr:YfhO family protein [Clostridiaceae bacterium]
MTKLENESQKQSIFKRFFVGNSYCWLACLCTVGVMMLVYYCYNLFPFGETTILRMDLYHQYGPLFAEFYDRVTNLKSFLYSWQTGLGSPFIGNFFNYLSSPSAIIMLILGHENMPEAIAGMIIAKAALAAGSFTYYLKKSQGRHDFTSAAFGVLYAMCGYFIAYYWNVMWIDAMVYFPLVVLGIENIINRRKPALYIAFLALTLLSNYYMGYMTCLFSVIYFLVYYFSKYELGSLDEKTPYVLSESGDKKYSFKSKVKGSIFLKSGFTFAFSSIAAAGLVAVALIPTFMILKSCSATSGTFPEEYSSYYSIFDFLANHLASVKPTIRSSGDTVLPNVYCGVATLMLVPMYLFTKSVPLKEKATNVALLGVFYFSFNINFLNYIWHGFHFPNDLPYRFSFMYSFILLTLAYKAFVRLNEFSGRAILGAGISVIGAIILIQKIGSKNVEEITILISLIFIVTYCLVFALVKNPQYQKSAVSVLLLCCVIGEVACANTDRYSMDQPKSNFVGDYAEFTELKEKLDEYDGGDDYRMDLTYNRARMDPAWYGYNGVSTFSSMAYEKLSNVQSDLGLYGNYINSYTYHLQTPVYNMMHSLKYIVDNNEDVTLESDYYTELMSSGKFTAYENNYYLPIGFAVNSELEDWYTDLNNPFTVQSDWFEYATGVTDVFGMMNIDEVQYYNMDEITSGLDTGDIYYTKSGSGEGELTFILKTEETKHCYLYVNSRDFDSITITKKGEDFTQYTDEPYIYDLGIVTPEEEIIVFIKIEESDYGYIDFYPYFVNDDKLNEGYEILKRRQLNVTSFEETRITGTVSADEDALFFTSIPYDKGWTVKLDGKEIGESDYVALADSAYLSFKLPAGEHTVELSFMPRGLILGAGISAFTVLALIAAAIIFARRRKKAALVPVIQPAEAESEPMSVSIDLPDESSAEQAESLEIGTEESEEEETATQEIGEESNSENPEAAQIIEEPASQEEAAETTVETEDGSGEPEDKTE